ncbi:DUF7848 domain-containing protein [Streptomyces sp. MSC1_001]
MRWKVLPDPARRPPIRYVQCKECDARSEVVVSQAEGDLWSMHHSGRTNHRQYREFAASDLVTEPVREGA